MYRYPPPPPPAQPWASGAEIAYDFGHGPRPPPYFATPPPGYPMPPPISGWGPPMGPPPMSLPPRGFPPRPFPPRGLPHGMRPPPPRGMPRPFPPGAGPPPIGFPPGTVSPPTLVPPGAAPPPFGLRHGVPPPIGLPPVGFPHGRVPPPRGFLPRPPPPSPPPGIYQSPRVGFTPGRGVALPANNHMNNGQTNQTNNQWSGQKRKAGENFTQQKQKKQKVDKRDLPENNVYFCEVCDRGFKTEDLYTTHVNSHEKCSVDGCQFTAHPKVVRLHFECQHGTGLAKRIWQMESKEDIDKWISERKMHYPTPENLQRKKQEQLKRIKNGAVLVNRDFGKLNGRGRGGGNRGRGRERYNGQRLIFEIPSAVNNETEAGGGTSEVVVTDEAPVLTDVNRAPVDKDPLPCNFQAKGKNHGKKPKDATLLEKLLAPDIRHERNVLLQCVRYVVEKFNLNQNTGN